MKFTAITIAALSASTVQAVAVAAPEAAPAADPWCLFKGQGCWKDKRDAAPAAEADPWCLFKGQGCWKNKMARDAEADPWCLFKGQGCWKNKRDASAEADPWCLFKGQGCWKDKREASPVAAPEPAADAEADPWCLFKGQGCWKDKREAAPEPEADPEAWCLFKGQGCWKVKRAAYAFANAIRGTASIKESRAAEISNYNGGAAYNAKRATEDIATLIASTSSSPEEFMAKLSIYSHFHGDSSNLTESSSTDDDDDETTTNATVVADEKRSLVGLTAREELSDATRRWCLFKGQGCWKRDAAPWCLFKGQGCWKRAVPMAERDAAADPWCLFKGQGCWKRTTTTTDLAARDAAAEPAFCPFADSTCYASKRDFAAADRRACNQPGEACDVARRAAEALVTEIEAWAPEARDTTVETRWCLFKGQGCWKRDAMDAVVARCNAEDGACAKAARDLEGMHTAARNLLEYLNEE